MRGINGGGAVAARSEDGNATQQQLQIIELDGKLEVLVDDIDRHRRSHLMTLARIQRSGPLAPRFDGVGGDVRKRRFITLDHHLHRPLSGVYFPLTFPAAGLSGPCPQRSGPSLPAGNPPSPEAARR
jgi:hypothetical protein